jgi:hypothetical protein
MIGTGEGRSGRCPEARQGGFAPLDPPPKAEPLESIHLVAEREGHCETAWVAWLTPAIAGMSQATQAVSQWPSLSATKERVPRAPPLAGIQGAAPLGGVQGQRPWPSLVRPTAGMT